jgi:hypothetical protein
VARLKQLIVDCDHPAALARFWAAVLDDFDLRPYDDAEVARLAALGATPDTDPVVILDGPGLELCFQRVDVQQVEKNPVHVDVTVEPGADRRTEVARLVALGASVREDFEAHTWMQDPEGNDFCVTDG